MIAQLNSSVPSSKALFSSRRDHRQSFPHPTLSIFAAAAHPRLRPVSAYSKLVLTPVEPNTGLDGTPIQQIDLSSKGDLMEVGREGDVEVTIPAPTVSKRHALFRCSKESSSELTVIDLESTNGTYINGKEVESMASGKLRLGDKITFGDVSYTLEQVD